MNREDDVGKIHDPASPSSNLDRRKISSTAEGWLFSVVASWASELDLRI